MTAERQAILLRLDPAGHDTHTPDIRACSGASPIVRSVRVGVGPVRLTKQTQVDAGGLKPNTWQRFERLGSAWEQAKLGLGDEPQDAAEDEPEVVANPRRRARTPLTESQVDAIRTARADGESVVSISRRFGVHRMTVWTHTKDLLS